MDYWRVWRRPSLLHTVSFWSCRKQGLSWGSGGRATAVHPLSEVPWWPQDSIWTGPGIRIWTVKWEASWNKVLCGTSGATALLRVATRHCSWLASPCCCEFTLFYRSPKRPAHVKSFPLAKVANSELTVKFFPIVVFTVWPLLCGGRQDENLVEDRTWSALSPSLILACSRILYSNIVISASSI